MFDRLGSLIDPRQNSFRRFSVVMLLSLVQLGSPAQATDRASYRVQAALRSELKLDADKRAELLEAALRVNPESAEAHWARGDVRVRGKWLSLEDSADEALARPNLTKYWDRRAEAGNNVTDQARMAEFCRANRMPAQERAHWAAVIALDPNHQAARRKLGQINVDGAWIDQHQIDGQKKKNHATTAYLQKNSRRLKELSLALLSESKTEQKVVKELREFRSPMVIPGLESLFSSTGPSGGHCTIETVSALTAPEASLSLARHALEFPDKSVRTRATDYLKTRDELSYVPELLAAMQTRVTKADGFTVNHSNQIVWRQRLLFETQDAKKVATIDRVFQFPATMSAWSTFNQQWAEGAITSANADLSTVNAAIDQKNANIMQLLESTTQDESSRSTAARTTPEDWWNWWNDRNESYPSDEKAVMARYQSTYTTVSEPAPRYDCLAAGTTIWTETGPVAIDAVKVGDLVLTQNQKSGELKYGAVLATATRPPEQLIRLKIDNEIVRATGGHPFWVTGKGWTKARSLEPGMGLHTARGFAVVDSATEEREPAESYNLIVDECHSYFVGKNLVLSHDNSNCEPVANRIPGLR